MKKNFFTVLCLICLLLCLASCTPSGESILQNMGDGGQYYSYDNGEKYVGGEFSKDTAKIKNIVIDWIKGSVTVIQNGETQNVDVAEDYEPTANTEAYRVHSYLDEDGTLYIRFMKYNLMISTELPVKNLTVTLPEEYEGETLTVNTSTAPVRLDGASFQKVHLESDGIGGKTTITDSNLGELFINLATDDALLKKSNIKKGNFIMGTGDVALNECTVDFLEVECKTGDIVLTKDDIKEADLHITLTGDFIGKEVTTESLEINCVVGDISLAFADGMKDYTLTASSNYPVQLTDEYVADNGKFVVGKGTATVKLVSSSGKILLGKNQEEDAEE